MDGVAYTIYARGNPKAYVLKDKRNRSWSPYQYVHFYIKKGEVVNVIVSGETKGNVSSVIGLPNDKNNFSTYSLAAGSNSFEANNDGVLSFTNQNEGENVFLEIESSHQRIPYFELYKNSNEDWDKEMIKYSDAPWVILSSSLSDIIVTYSSAKEFIKDAHKLMEDNERIINIENSVTGLIENGKADYKLDNNRALHLESFNGYMYASNEYTGYNRANGAMPNLLGLSNSRWGVWHENGHQRQQFPWEWSAGTGMTEVTVNIYSLFVEEQIFGRATNFDTHYPAIKNFLAKSVKSYDDEDLFVKLGIFWQLRLAFGDQFYPQLHQCYRLMHNTPSNNYNHEQKQLFIITVSNLVNINLEPFFSKWGIYSDLNTLVQLSFLPDLTNPIWEYNNDDYHPLPIPEPKYIPELIYLKNSIKNVELTENRISFLIDKDWYAPYQYYFMLNGEYLAEVNNGIFYYCNKILTNEGYKVEIRLSNPLKDSDIFSVEVNFEGKHIAYYSSVLINNLWDDVQKLYSDDSFTSLSPETNQRTIDDLWRRYDESKNDHTIRIRNKILLAQQLYLVKTIKSDNRNESFYFVEFYNESFKDYLYSASSSGKLIGLLRNGNPMLSDTIEGKTWRIPAERYEFEQIDITVMVHEKELLIRRVSWEYFILRNKIEELSGNSDVNQKDIDDIRNDILNSDLPFWSAHLLISQLDELQKLFLINTIADVYLSNQRLNVVFSDNTLFRNYRYMLNYDSGYISEVSYGQNYYSSLNGNVWSTTITQEMLDSLYITAYVNNTWYRVYEFSSKTDNFVFDYPV